MSVCFWCWLRLVWYRVGRGDLNQWLHLLMLQRKIIVDREFQSIFTVTREISCSWELHLSTWWSAGNNFGRILQRLRLSVGLCFYSFFLYRIRGCCCCCCCNCNCNCKCSKGGSTFIIHSSSPDMTFEHEWSWVGTLISSAILLEIKNQHFVL